MTKNYRPEIDGLRTIAVAAVVFYHAKLSLFQYNVFSGGFLGVDIFFVISGYLITRIVYSEISAGEFSFIRFYNRRARRILPALFVVMLVSTPFAYFLMGRSALLEYANSIQSSILFVSNIFFWMQDSYTAEPSALKPFLHTWSLSVEEQFYVIFPPMMLCFLFFGKAKKLIFVLMLISFAGAVVTTKIAPDAAFFLLPTRMWELMAGAILGVTEIEKGRVVSPRNSRCLSLLGLILIIGSMVVFNHNTAHPSVATVVPIVGTMLIIWYSTEHGIVYRTLSSKFFVKIGLISYSLYLWHYPIFSFTRIYAGDLRSEVALILVIISLILALLTYHLIEKPVRDFRFVDKRRFYLGLAITCPMLLLISVGLEYQAKSNGLRVTGPASEMIREARWERLIQGGRDCNKRDISDLCKFNLDHKKPAIINLGDSHAWNLGRPLKELADRKKRPYIEIVHGGCAYILNTYMFREGKKFECDEEYVKEIHEYLSTLDPSVIVYTARLPVYLDEGRYFDNKEGGVESEVSQNSAHAMYTLDGSKRKEDLEPLVRATLQKLLDDGHTLVLMYPIPAVGWHVPWMAEQLLLDASWNNFNDDFSSISLTTSYEVFKKRVRFVESIYDSFSDHPNVKRVYPATLFCSEESGRCRTHSDTELFYIDDDHPSPAASEMIADSVGVVLRQ